MIRNTTIPVLNNTDVNSFASEISESIYNCVKSCSSRNMAQSRPNCNNQSNSYHSRWNQLLHDPNDSRVWRALDWKGEFIDRNNSNHQSSPTDGEGELWTGRESLLTAIIVITKALPLMMRESFGLEGRVY